ncbi:sulfatase family protein, partial [Flavobacterium sp.]|uniref:sulfatase family protein n=1 Tax=Flavobacterium sp. TaxID=239 RepID=UPI003C6668C2
MQKKILVFIGLFFFTTIVKSQENNLKPNILFIMADDHTSQAIGAYGGRLQKLNPTPTIDQLAKEGIIMQNAFCTNAICTPSRACIMTGQYSAVNGVTNLNGKLKTENQYLAIEMKKAGYETAVIGKWHLKENPEAFDFYKVMYNQGEYFDPHFIVRGGTEEFLRTAGGKTSLIKGTVSMKGHSTDCIADSALDWFKKGRDGKKPFFLKLHFKAPHDDFENAPRYDSYLEDVEIPEPDNLFEQGNHGSIATRGYLDELLPYIGTSVSSRNTRRNYAKKWGGKGDINSVAATKNAYQTYMKKYLRCVKGVDDNVKRVIDYLKAENLLDNTIIIYTGDQGFYLGEHDYIDKRWGYDEGMRMPFIVRYPKAIPAGSTSDAIIENVDFPVMMLDYAGIKKPDYMQGYSFRKIMETGVESKEWKKAAYYHYWMHMTSHDNPGHIGIRTKKYKLLFFYGADEKSDKAETPPAWELYDLEKDPHEMNNIYDNPAYSKVIAGLKTELKNLRKEYKEDDPKYKCNKVIDEFWDYTAK